MFASLLLLSGNPHQGPQAPGTYTVAFCTSECAISDSSRAVARGILVLDSAYGSQQIMFVGRANGCFDFQRSPSLESYAVLFTQGYTQWTYADSSSITFFTYRSPDASHQVTAHLTDSGFVGLGHSRGAGAAAIEVPDEYVVGYRLGPPDMHRCGIVRTDRRDSWLSPVLFGLMAVGLLLVVRPRAW